MSKKGENIYKRKDGRWEGRYPKEYLKTGKIRYGYCYGKTYKEVKEKVQTAKCNLTSELNLKKLLSQKALSVFCDEWLQLKRTKVKQATLVKYCTNIEKHIKPYLGDIQIGMLNSLIIEEFSHNLLLNEKLSAKTVTDILSQLKSILKYVSKQKVDLSRVEIVYPKNIKKHIRVLSKDEEQIFVEYLLNDMNSSKFGVLLALMTGLRIGEICALRWCDISINNRIIKVSSTMQRIHDIGCHDNKKTRIIISEPKSDNSTRIIPISDSLLEICKKNFVPDPLAFVLTGSREVFVEPRTLQYRFSKYIKACNLSDVHFHVLRHTFATRCVEVGFEIKSLSEILGHASPKITLERYVHSSIELKRDNMKKLDEIYFFK